MFALLRRLVEFVRPQYKSGKESLITLSYYAPLVTVSKIDIDDVIEWTKDNMEELQKEKATEINVIIGNALAMFIINNQRRHLYLNISDTEIEAFRDGIVLVAMDKKNKVVKDQLIRSSKGISEVLINQFEGKEILKIKLQD